MGHAAAALNGDVPQKLREQTVERLRRGRLDVLVATDVAARGLDVERISHVINFDMPYDTEAYVHRIGRTGRAGRKGEAILFVTPREKRMLRTIERATRRPLEPLTLPTTEEVNRERIRRFKARVLEVLDGEDLKVFIPIMEEFLRDSDRSPAEICAALAKMAQGERPLLIADRPERQERREDRGYERGFGRDEQRRGTGRGEAGRVRPQRPPEEGFERFRISVGYIHGVKPGNIVGAITNEVGLTSKDIGRIEIFDRESLVDLPADLPPEIVSDLGRVRVCGQRLRIVLAKDAPSSAAGHGGRRFQRRPRPGFKSGVRKGGWKPRGKYRSSS